MTNMEKAKAVCLSHAQSGNLPDSKIENVVFLMGVDEAELRKELGILNEERSARQKCGMT